MLCFLLADNTTRDILTRILNKKRRFTREGLVDLIEHYYLGGIDNLDRNWRKWRGDPSCDIAIP